MNFSQSIIGCCSKRSLESWLFLLVSFVYLQTQLENFVDVVAAAAKETSSNVGAAFSIGASSSLSNGIVSPSSAASGTTGSYQIVF